MRPTLKLSDLPPAMRKKFQGSGRSREVARAIRVEQDRLRTDTFLTMLERAGLPGTTPEYQFHADRKWRFDFAWPEFRVALEVEGGVWTQGRHTRGSGFVKDMEKYNAAAVMGWRVVRVTPDRMTTKATQEMLRRLLK